MNKTEVKAPVLIGIAVCVVGVLAYLGVRIIGQAGNLDQGQVSYTPGVPPWAEKDASKRGPGGANGRGTAAQANVPEAPPMVGNK